MKKILLIPWLLGSVLGYAQSDTSVIRTIIAGKEYFTPICPSVMLIKLGLANVSNTSDANKPVSTAEQSALNLKFNISDSGTMLNNYARTASMTALLAAKSATGHTHAESEVTNLTSDLSLKAPTASPIFTGTVTLPNGTVTNIMLAGSIDATAKLTGVLPFAQGGISGAQAAPATTGTMTINMTASVITITPTGAVTFNASGGVAGEIVTFSITTSGTTSFILTWGSNFRKTGTLATGITSARFFTVSFVCLDGTVWSEVSRTAVQS